jgi:polyhydroxyalkanoate synthesis regulator phasin
MKAEVLAIIEQVKQGLKDGAAAKIDSDLQPMIDQVSALPEVAGVPDVDALKAQVSDLQAKLADAEQKLASVDQLAKQIDASIPDAQA